MVEKILKIANQNPNGFTVTKELKKVITGYVVATLETQNSFGIEGLKKVIAFAFKNDTCIGGWKEEDLFYFDASKVFTDKEEAIKEGLKNKQIAIYDLDNNEVIYL